jgi:broad specificity phosphatase PhoE
MIIEKPFYFVRHGETEHNRMHLCAGGQTDVPLNETGKFQAKSLREKIISLDINRVICSPLIRAIQTAKLATWHPMTVENDIRECDLGDFEGKAVPEFIQYIETANGNISFPNGESKNDFNKRVVTAFNEALLTYRENLLFVSHGMVYWSLLEIMGIPFHYIPNASLVHFKVENKVWGASKIQMEPNKIISTNMGNYG